MLCVKTSDSKEENSRSLFFQNVYITHASIKKSHYEREKLLVKNQNKGKNRSLKKWNMIFESKLSRRIAFEWR